MQIVVVLFLELERTLRCLEKCPKDWENHFKESMKDLSFPAGFRFLDRKGTR